MNLIFLGAPGAGIGHGGGLVRIQTEGFLVIANDEDTLLCCFLC